MKKNWCAAKEKSPNCVDGFDEIFVNSCKSCNRKMQNNKKIHNPHTLNTNTKEVRMNDVFGVLGLRRGGIRPASQWEEGTHRGEGGMALGLSHRENHVAFITRESRSPNPVRGGNCK